MKTKYSQAALTNRSTELTTSPIPLERPRQLLWEQEQESGTGPWSSSVRTSANFPSPDLFYHIEHPSLPLSALHFTHVLPTLPSVQEQCPDPLPLRGVKEEAIKLQEGGTSTDNPSPWTLLPALLGEPKRPFIKKQCYKIGQLPPMALLVL